MDMDYMTESDTRAIVSNNVITDSLEMSQITDMDYPNVQYDEEVYDEIIEEEGNQGVNYDEGALDTVYVLPPPTVGAEETEDVIGIDTEYVYEEITRAHCIECDAIVDKKEKKHTLKDCNFHKDLKCDVCGAKFNVAQNLKVHKLVIHSDKSTFTPGSECPFCDSRRKRKVFQRYCSYIAHLVTHLKPDNFPCKICSEEFEFAVLLHRHTRLDHGIRLNPEPSGYSQEIGYCPQCSCLIEVDKIKSHRATHKVHQAIQKKKQGGPQKRKVEERRNSTLSNSKEDKLKHLCKECGKKFRRPIELKRHMNIHNTSDNRLFSCNQCDRKFAHESSLLSHKKRVHKGKGKTFPCAVCGQIFNKWSNMERHVQATHPLDTATAIFDCPHCPCQFRHEGALKRHVTNIHDAKLEGDLPACETCGRVFLRKSQLTRHVKLHMADAHRPLACRRCSKRFKLRSSLKVHLDMHLRRDIDDPALTNPICAVCMKHFSSQSALRKHSRIHSSVYDCNDCYQRFPSIYRLDKHQCPSTRPRGGGGGGGVAGELVPPETGEGLTDLSVAHGPSASTPLRQSNTKTDLMAAKMAATANRLYHCRACVQSFATFRAFKDHNALHQGLKPYMCWTCHLSFRTADRLAIHKEVHNREPAYCEHCPAVLNGRAQLAEHEKLIHSIGFHQLPPMVQRSDAYSTQSFPDMDCGQQQSDAGNMGYRERAHSAEPQCLPNGDQNSLVQYYWTNDNTDTVPDRAVRCDICNHLYDSVAQLSTHWLQGEVLTDREHQFGVVGCPVCGQRFTGTRAAGEHLSALHPFVDQTAMSQAIFTSVMEVGGDHGRLNYIAAPGGSNFEVETQGQTRDAERKHHCRHCNVAFRKKSDLTRHERIHTGELPFECDECGRSFRVRSTLTSHKKTHEQGTPEHECQVCNQRFFTKNAMILHLRKHSGEKPLQCRFCPILFRTSAARQRHETKDHSTRRDGAASSKTAVAEHLTDTDAVVRIPTTVKKDPPIINVGSTGLNKPKRARRPGYVRAFHDFAPMDMKSSSLLPVKQLPVNIVQESKEARAAREMANTVAQISTLRPAALGSSARSSAFVPATTDTGNVFMTQHRLEQIHITARRLNPHEYSVSLSRTHPKSIRSGVDTTASVALATLSALAEQDSSLRLPLSDSRMLHINVKPALQSLGSDDTVLLRARPSEGKSLCVEIIDTEVAEFCKRCEICELDLPTKEISDAHFSSDDHETANINGLNPLAGSVHDTMDQLMIPVAIPQTRKEEFTCCCRLCGRKFLDMELLVAHIRRDHERDPPQSLAPRPLARTAPLPMERHLDQQMQ